MCTIIHIQHPLAEEQHVRVKYSIYSLMANRQSLWYFWYICPVFGYILRCLLASIRVDGRLRMRILSPTYARMVASKHMQRRLKLGKTKQRWYKKQTMHFLPMGINGGGGDITLWFSSCYTRLLFAIIKRCFKMACWHGRVQINLTLLSLTAPLPGGKWKSLYRDLDW